MTCCSHNRINAAAAWRRWRRLAALLRRSPLAQGLQPQAEALIVDTQIPVRAARNRIGLHSRNFLRHHPDVGRIAPEVAETIEIDPVVFSDLGDVPLQANVGSPAAAAPTPLREP